MSAYKIILAMKKSILFFFSSTLIALFIDFFFFFLLEKPLVYALLCIFAINALRPFWLRIALLMALISCQSFVYYGIFGLPLLYLIPIAVIAGRMQKACYITPTYRYGILLMCLLGQLVVEQAVLNVPTTPSYTLTTIFANIVVLTLFSWFKQV